MDINLYQRLPVPRCPWRDCNIANPLLEIAWKRPAIFKYGGYRYWAVYKCSSCDQMVMGTWLSLNDQSGYPIFDIGDTYSGSLKYFPAGQSSLDESVPARVSRYLTQAQDTVAQPDACIMTSSSAIDAMLKEKGFADGSVSKRLGEAAKANVITQDMCDWGHHVRLEGNDSRHVDGDVPTTDEASQCLEFALALAEVLFVLPARVTRGIGKAETMQKSTTENENDNG